MGGALPIRGTWTIVVVAMASYIDLVIFFVFFSLLLGCICREISKLWGLPYSPMLLILGLAWGGLEDWIGFVGDSSSLIKQIEPVSLTQHAILMIFLPVFAFTSAYYTDYHVMKRNIFQALLLAGPGIVLVAVFLAIVFKYMLGYDFNWAECLLIGAILAETDPVAVSSLLEDIGVSEGISYVVDGESLLNDATSIVMFMVMEGIVKEDTTSAGEVISLLAKLTLGSGCVGLGFALVTWFWMRRLADDPIEVTTLTLLGSYLLFVICEGQDLDMSGILAICSFGYFLCGYSEASMSPLVLEPLGVVWDFLAFLAQTVIYFLTGIIIGGAVFRDGNITGFDWAMLGVNCILQYLARALMIACFYPILKKVGYSINWKSFIVYVHSGLRGTVGLVLGLTVWFDSDYSERLRTVTVLHLAGLACFTVIFNGFSAKGILRLLKLGRTTHEQEIAVSQAVKSMVTQVEGKVAKLAHTTGWEMVDWEQVIARSGMNRLPEDVLMQLTHGRKTLKQLRKRGETAENLLSEYEEVLSSASDSNKLIEARSRFLSIVKSQYLAAKSEGQCNPETYVFLFHSVCKAQDLTSVKISSWEMLESGLLNGPFQKVFMRVKNTPLIGRLARRYLYNSVGEAYDACLAFLKANEEALEEMHEYFDGLTSAVSDKLLTEIREQITACKDFVDYEITGAFPQIVKSVQEKHALCYILNCLRDIIDSAEEGGVLTEKESRVIGDGLKDRLWKLYYHNPWRQMPDLGSMFDLIPLFQGLSPDLREQVLAESQVTLVPKGGQIFTPGERLSRVFIVLHGRVVESNGKGKKYEHEQGSLVGAEYFLTTASVATTKASAATLTYIQTFPISVFKANFDTLELRLWQAAAPIVIMFSSGKSKNMPALHTYALKKIVTSSEVSIFRAGDVMDLPHGGITLIPVAETDPNAEGDQVTDRTAVHQLVIVSLVDPHDGGEGEVAEQMTVAVRFREDLHQAWVEKNRDMRKALYAYTANERPASLLVNHKTSFGEDEAVHVDIPDSP